MFDRVAAAELTSLHERLGAFVGGFDPADMVAADANRVVELAAGIERLAATLKTLAAGRVAGAGSWQGHGDRSPADWLARTTGTSFGDARATLDTARHLRRAPATEAAMRHGALSVAQARVVAATAAVDPAAERRLLARAPQASLGELRDDCARVIAAADPDPEATHQRIHHSRHLCTRTDPDGAFRLDARGTTADGARILAALRHRADRIFQRARRAGRHEPTSAYLFDALVELCTGATTDTATPAGADAKIIVRVDHTALVRGHVADGEICEIAGIGPIPVSVVRTWTHDAFLAAIVTNGTDIRAVTHLGRRPTALQRTALQWRTPTCSRLGCHHSARLEIDHTTDWAHTHHTRLDDLDPLCAHDHALKTRHGWALEPGTGKRQLVPPGHPNHPHTASEPARDPPPARSQFDLPCL